MQPSSSRDSVPSPVFERRSLDLDGPRKHHRRAAAAQGGHGQGQGYGQQGVDGANREQRGHRSSSRSSRRMSTGTQTARRLSVPVAGSSRSDLFEDLDENEDGRGYPSSTPYSSTTYAAGPSGGAGDELSSSGGGSSSDFQVFDWDVGGKRAGGRPRSSGHGENDADGSKGRPGARLRGGSSRLRLGNSPSRPATGNGTATKASGVANIRGTPNGNTAAAQHARLGGHESHGHQTPPSTPNWQTPSWKRQRSGRWLGLNPAIELLILSGAALATCVRLATHDLEKTRALAVEFALVAVTSVAYAVLRPPGDQGTIWATDSRNYRESSEDGTLTGLLMGPLLAASCLFAAFEEGPETTSLSPSGDPLPFPPWRVEGPPPILQHSEPPPHKLSALTLSRHSLVSLNTLTAMTLLCHLLATRWIRKPHEFPASNLRKFASFLLFATVLSGLLDLVREAASAASVPLWTELARWEVFTIALVFQANLYTISRLARRGFTLGELAIVAAVGATLSMEATHLTIAKLWPLRTPYVKTFRRPTPLLIFQLALIVGTFMIGFLLSPLLVLSRHLAQKPIHRLRWPDKRDLHRRLLAGFFYGFAACFIVGVIGMWVRWLLVRRDPWFWVIHFLLKGQRWWSRPALITYWASLVTTSVATWQAIVAGAKRYRSLGTSNSLVHPTKPTAKVVAIPSQEAPSGIEVVDSSKRAPQAGVSRPVGALNVTTAAAAATEGGGATLKKAAHLSLNARRKFFHALAVLLFVPGIAFDPAFTHLAFSLAFSIFIFAEYVRYYALYPFGASLHVFMSEFLDHKDSGPVVLSHFYLLTGCAGTLWLEGPSPITHHTGVLVLGVGDALASIIGRRYGKVHWPGSSKTVEGSAAFCVSIIFSAWLLRLFHLAGSFSLLRYSFVILTAGLLEAVSMQNDNLIIPVFAFVVSTLVYL